MIRMIKPSGVVVVINDEESTIQAAAELGWQPEAGNSEEKPKKRGRPSKNKE